MMIEIQNIVKSFKATKAINDVSLEIPEGLFLALLGPNGAGKTTLVEILEGIQEPDSGLILIDDKTWQSEPKALRQIMGICLQETQYMDKVTVEETIRMFTYIYHIQKSNADKLIQEFGITPFLKQYITTLSGGQRQKVSLLLALLHNPKILILDEPTTGLDPSFRREIWDLLLTYKEKGLTMILTTHYMEEAVILCDHIVLMNQGKIIKQGNLQALLKTLPTEHKIKFDLKVKNINDLLLGDIKIIWDINQKSGTILTDDPMDCLMTVLNSFKKSDLEIDRLEISHHTLEDVFIHLTGKGFDEP